jgi:septum formation protein
VVSSEVCFLASSQIDVDGYLAAVSPLDKAGGYNVAERGELLLASYRGSWTNIMGLPREWLVEQLADILPVPLPESRLMPMIPEKNDA